MTSIYERCQLKGFVFESGKLLPGATDLGEEYDILSYRKGTDNIVQDEIYLELAKGCYDDCGDEELVASQHHFEGGITYRPEDKFFVHIFFMHIACLECESCIKHLPSKRRLNALKLERKVWWVGECWMPRWKIRLVNVWDEALKLYDKDD